MISHGFKIQIGKMNVLEGVAGLEQKNLEALPFHPLGHAVGCGVAHLGHVGFIEQAIEPDMVHTDLFGFSQLLVKGQRQFRNVHGNAKAMPASGPAGGVACRVRSGACLGLPPPRGQQRRCRRAQAGSFDGG